MTPSFASILSAAERRHGIEGVAARLAEPRSEAELRALPDDRYLSSMCLRIFRAGLKHELVDAKWPAFEEVWHGFDPARCASVYDEDIEAMLEDRRLIRHLGKLYIGENRKELIECDLKLELEGIANYRKAIGICEAAKDYVSRDLISEILEDEEDHQDHNTMELELIDKIGIENFGRSQI